MRETVAIFLLLFAASCGYDRFDAIGRGDIPGNGLLPDTDIAMLYDNYFGGQATINDDITIGGHVTANDLSGNWFRSFVIEDPTGAVEIRAGVADMHNFYQLGRRVVVRAKGLAVGSYNGVIQLGRKVNPYSEWRVEEFGARIILERYVYRDNVFSEVVPDELKISELTERHCGRLVRVGKAIYSAGEGEAAGWAFPGGEGAVPATGVRRFIDGGGATIDVVTSGYANFADTAIPADSVWLTGIVLRGKFDGGPERFGIRLRSVEDVEAD